MKNSILNQTSKILLLVGAFLMINNCKAQEIEVSTSLSYKSGEPYAVVDGGKRYYKFGDNVLALKIGKKNIITIQILSPDELTEIDRNDYADMPKKWYSRGIITLNDNYYFIYYTYDKPSNMGALHYRKLDEDGKMGESNKFYSTTQKTTSTNISTSGDNSKLLVTYRVKPLTRKDKYSYDIIGYNVFDSELDEIWAAEKKMPYTEKQMDNIDYTLDEDGNVYLFANIRESKGEFRRSLLKFDMENDVEEFELDEFDFYIHSFAVFENTVGEMVCAGYANTDKRGRGANAAFVQKIAYDGTIISNEVFEFPQELMNKYKKSKRDAKGISQLKFDKLLLNEDGSMVMIGEVYYVLSHTSTNANGGTTTTYTYHYEDMLVTKINENDEVEWMQKLPKIQQGSKGLGGMSYYHFYSNGYHYMVYLDNLKNIDLDINERPKRHMDGRGGYLTAYQINDETGEVRKLSILNIKKVKGPEKEIEIYQFSVNRIIGLDNGDFVFESYIKKKRDMLIKVKID